MKRKLQWLLLWSWLVTLPIALVAGYLSYKTIDRYTTFSVRYNPYPARLTLKKMAVYEWDSMFLAMKVAVNRYFNNNQQHFKSIHLFASESKLARLEEHLPQSGYQYIKAALADGKQLIKAKIRYRGDFSYHWAWKKKSIRVKTSKNNLYKGLRTFNLLAPQFAEQLNNYFAYQLATQMGILAPRSDLLRVYMNGGDLGIHVLVEQLSETTLRNNQLMPIDIYRGELYGKDAFTGSGIDTLFETASVWDKVAVNNHYDKDKKVALEKLIKIIQKPQSSANQKKLSELLDMQAWARFSLFESLIQTRHYDDFHNWRLAYDPWKQKLIPIVWDPLGWAKGWFIEKQAGITDINILNSALHQALYNNGDFLTARYKQALAFYRSEQDKKFLGFVDETINIMQAEVKLDPVLNPPDISQVSHDMLELQDIIAQVFEDVKNGMLEDKQSAWYQFNENKLDLYLSSHRVVQKLALVFDQDIHKVPHVQISYDGMSGIAKQDLSKAVVLKSNQLVINAELLPRLNVINKIFDNNSYAGLAANYQLKLGQIPLHLHLLNVMIDYGRGWENARRASDEQLANLQEQKTKLVQKPATISWQLFYDTGHGFRQQDSINIKQKTGENSLWNYRMSVPAGLKQIRVDLPNHSYLGISDINFYIEEKKITIKLDSVHLNNLEWKDNKILSNGNKDPYFYFDVSQYSSSSISDFALSFRVSRTPQKIYQPIAAQEIQTPLIWSGNILIDGIKTITRPLYIKPGTQILLAENASLVIKSRVQAIGTKEKPIRFLAQNAKQLPWGAVVLFGEQANLSRIQHCEFAQGSGFKGDLFEYTGMLSIHNVKQTIISDCLFRDNAVVDDMVHVVYSDIDFRRNIFRHAYSDALDIDISSATITDSLFENSGNDAIDIMTSRVNVAGTVFRSSGDKGISVGENSQLFAVDNKLIANKLGVQVKDNSTALLTNHSFIENGMALSAYKKNWRYGRGGQVILAKSVLQGNTQNIDIKKASKAWLFDTVIDGEDIADNKRIKTWWIDRQQDKVKSSLALNERIRNIPEVDDILKNTPAEFLQRRENQVRGAMLHEP